MILNSIKKTEKLEYLFNLLDYEMMEYIYMVIVYKEDDLKYSALTLNNMLTYYIDVRKILYSDSPDNQKDLFLCLTCSRSDFREYRNKLKREWKYRKPKQDLDMTDKIQYVVNFLTNEYIYQVLEDSCIDPEYSAVTLNNEMICYLELLDLVGMNSLKKVRDLFLSLGHTESEFDIFEEKRKKESVYYRGKQYTE